MSLPRILLYATASCPHCEAARAVIRESGETWEERDPTSSEERLRELLMVAASATVPTLVIGNRALVGFDRDRFEQMLRMPPLEPPLHEPETPEELPEADPILPGRKIDGWGWTSPEE